MANLFNSKHRYSFDFSMKKVRVLCDNQMEWQVMTKHDMSYHAVHMFPTTTLAISPEYLSYEECKESFKKMLLQKNYDNVSIFEKE